MVDVMANENKLALTVDIEDWYHIPSVTGSPFSVYPHVNTFYEKWAGRYDYLSEPTTRVLNLLDDFGIKCTFFVVADIVNKYPGLVEKIHDCGHEIACHGLYHECHIHPKTKEPLITTDSFISKISEAKSILEEITGSKILGYRAPNALFGEWMYDILSLLGFKYDSSIMSNSIVKKYSITKKDVPSHPYQVNNVPNSFYEFPLAYWNLCGFKFPASGGPYLRFFGSNLMLNGIHQSLQRGHTVFYFHPLDISHETFPKLGKNRPFYWAIKGKIIEKRIRHIISNLSEETELTTLENMYHELLVNKSLEEVVHD